MNRWQKKQRTQFGNLAVWMLAGTLFFAATADGQNSSTETAPISTDAASESYREAQYEALAQDVDAMERQLGIVKRVVRLVSPTVVHVEATPIGGRIGPLRIEEEGSGVVVRFGGEFYVLTNRHVIRHSNQFNIRVQLADGRILQPSRVWFDPDTDVAAMAIDAPGLIAAKLGNSDRLEIGDYVLAVGSPFGLSQSVTRGIVSAKGRYDLDLGDGELKFMNFIQTDAAINPGNSGGPLVNLRGEVVGLNTAIASSSGGNEGIGFTIPINIVARIARELVHDRQAPRGFLGVKLDFDFDADDARALGLRRLMGTKVTAIEPNSPAEKADLRVDDVIVAYDGVRVEKDDHLISLVKLTDIGRDVEMVLIRDGSPLRKKVTIGDLRTETVLE